MRHFSLLAVSLLALVACTPEKQQEVDYAQYVNPMIGTDFTGNTYPGAQAPFGMVQLSPDNGLPGWDRLFLSRHDNCRFQPYTSFRYRSRRSVRYLFYAGDPSV